MRATKTHWTIFRGPIHNSYTLPYWTAAARRVNFGEDIRRRLIHTAQAGRGVVSSVAVNPVPCFIQTSLSIGAARRLLSRRNGEKFTSDGLGGRKTDRTATDVVPFSGSRPGKKKKGKTAARWSFKWSPKVGGNSWAAPPPPSLFIHGVIVRRTKPFLTQT